MSDRTCIIIAVIVFAAAMAFAAWLIGGDGTRLLLNN
jgi:hypothetical protein